MAAAGLLASLPKPRNGTGTRDDELRQGIGEEKLHAVVSLNQKNVEKAPRVAPEYGKRTNFVPRKQSDYDDGGAFPEIFMPQYPLGLGLRDQSESVKTLALKVGANGDVGYDAITNQQNKIVYNQHNQLIPKVDMLKDEMVRPSKEEEMVTAKRTAAALEKRVQTKLSAAQPTTLAPQPAPAQFIKYTPSTQGGAYNSGAKTRIVKMTEAPIDPFEPPKFRHKRVPRGPGSPPVPVMHSPPRAVTAEDQKDWKIPPCVSNWKNTRGYTIPLDKRLAADGRGLQDVQINDNFAKLSESLYVAEQTARKAVEMRSKIQKEMMMREKEKKEETLRDLAQKARMERIGGPLGPPEAVGRVAHEENRKSFKENSDDDDDRTTNGRHVRAEYEYDLSGKESNHGDENVRMRETDVERKERLRREEIREERRKERERERRLEAKGEHLNKKSKLTRDRDRDVSERIALGQANVKSSSGAMYDQRLFNQDSGIGSGYNQDDAYNVYDKALFADRGSNLYKPKGVDDGEAYGNDAPDNDNILSTAKFKPDKGFSGADGRGANGNSGPRSRPVEFEADTEDPFGLDKFMKEVETGGKQE